MICWLDLETTGLEPKVGSILEIAIIVTDDKLNEIGEPFVSLVKPLHLRGMEVMDDFVMSMHQTSGLADQIWPPRVQPVSPGVSSVVYALRDDLPRLGEVEQAARVHMMQLCPPEVTPEWVKLDTYHEILRKTSIAGSSIHFDRAWLHEHMSDFEGMFSHRMIDVSSFTLEAGMVAPEIYKRRPGLGPDGKPLPQHRALDDIRSSIATLRYYRKHMSWSFPPDEITVIGQ